MGVANKLEVKAEQLAGRITSLSLFGFGVGFKPTEVERTVVRELLISLEDRRALYVGAIWEQPRHVIKSVLQIRQELTSILKRLKEGSAATSICFAMREACANFLSEVREDEFPDGMLDARDFRMEQLLLHLGQLRAVVGQHIAALAFLYRIDVFGRLTKILPPVSAVKAPKRKGKAITTEKT